MLLDGIEPQDSHGAQGQPAPSKFGLIVGGHSDHVEEQFGQGPGPETVKGTCRWCALLYNFSLCRSISQTSSFF